MKFSLALDQAGKGDHVVEHDGAKVLLVSQEISGMLEGVTIDCQEEAAEGSRLVIFKNS